MISTIKYIITTETNPYKNLAMEEYLLKQVKEDEVILYLWQNERTVVIGKNQNPWKECKLAELEEDGGSLVRRLSGGGAVFHDLGNLNFTFLATKDNYNVERQLEVILKAVNQLGIPAEKSGRNDITVEGRKFSGNAFYNDGVHYYHHGTILVNVDMSKLSHYLNVSREKLVSKGVESVRARVTNLTEYIPELSIDRMRKELVKAYSEVYELAPVELNAYELDSLKLDKLENKFASWEWILGKKMEFNYSLDRRFPWGNIDLEFVVDSGRIVNCKAYSDALETEYFIKLSTELIDCNFSSVEMLKAMEQLTVSSEEALIHQDVIMLLQEVKL
jgi:lipoate-protein ligase A